MARLILMNLYGSAWAVSNPVHVYSIYAFNYSMIKLCADILISRRGLGARACAVLRLPTQLSRLLLAALT